MLGSINQRKGLIIQMSDSDQTVYIVSGLPRSGTSMMMQMLEAGGLEIVTDNMTIYRGILNSKE
jgi:hypothetical protein